MSMNPPSSSTSSTASCVCNIELRSLLARANFEQKVCLNISPYNYDENHEKISIRSVTLEEMRFLPTSCTGQLFADLKDKHFIGTLSLCTMCSNKSKTKTIEPSISSSTLSSMKSSIQDISNLLKYLFSNNLVCYTSLILSRPKNGFVPTEGLLFPMGLNKAIIYMDEELQPMVSLRNTTWKKYLIPLDSKLIKPNEVIATNKPNPSVNSTLSTISNKPIISKRGKQILLGQQNNINSNNNLNNTTIIDHNQTTNIKENPKNKYIQLIQNVQDEVTNHERSLAENLSEDKPLPNFNSFINHASLHIKPSSSMTNITQSTKQTIESTTNPSNHMNNNDSQSLTDEVQQGTSNESSQIFSTLQDDSSSILEVNQPNLMMYNATFGGFGEPSIHYIPQENTLTTDIVEHSFGGSSFPLLGLITSPKSSRPPLFTSSTTVNNSSSPSLVQSIFGTVMNSATKGITSIMKGYFNVPSIENNENPSQLQQSNVENKITNISSPAIKSEIPKPTNISSNQESNINTPILDTSLALDYPPEIKELLQEFQQLPSTWYTKLLSIYSIKDKSTLIHLSKEFVLLIKEFTPSTKTNSLNKNNLSNTKQKNNKTIQKKKKLDLLNDGINTLITSMKFLFKRKLGSNSETLHCMAVLLFVYALILFEYSLTLSSTAKQFIQKELSSQINQIGSRLSLLFGSPCIQHVKIFSLLSIDTMIWQNNENDRSHLLLQYWVDWIHQLYESMEYWDLILPILNEFDDRYKRLSESPMKVSAPLSVPSNQIGIAQYPTENPIADFLADDTAADSMVFLAPQPIPSAIPMKRQNSLVNPRQPLPGHRMTMGIKRSVSIVQVNNTKPSLVEHQLLKKQRTSSTENILQQQTNPISSSSTTASRILLQQTTISSPSPKRTRKIYSSPSFASPDQRPNRVVIESTPMEVYPSSQSNSGSKPQFQQIIEKTPDLFEGLIDSDHPQEGFRYSLQFHQQSTSSTSTPVLESQGPSLRRTRSNPLQQQRRLFE